MPKQKKQQQKIDEFQSQNVNNNKDKTTAATTVHAPVLFLSAKLFSQWNPFDEQVKQIKENTHKHMRTNAKNWIASKMSLSAVCEIY